MLLADGDAADGVRSALADELVALSGGRLERHALRTDVRHVHFGCKGRNPLESVHFFDNKRRVRTPADGDGEEGGGAEGGGGGRPMLLRAERRAIPPARLPGAFQERSVRVFVVDERWEEAARAALGAWCAGGGGEQGCEIDPMPSTASSRRDHVTLGGKGRGVTQWRAR